MPTVASDGRPFGHRRRQPRGEISKLLIAVHDTPADEREYRRDRSNLVLGHRKVVAVEGNEIRELAWCDPALLAFFGGEPGAALGPKTKRRGSIEARGFGRKPQTTDRAAGDQPVERDPCPW